MQKLKEIRNVIVISDTHGGCQLGLYKPDKTFRLDNGGKYTPSRLQMKLWAMWEEFWGEWVPMVTKGEDYVIVHNGDAIDGVHHGSTTQITHNLNDQREIAFNFLKDVVNNKKCAKYYHIRGTEAHVGKSGSDEETLARKLGAIPDEQGNFARWDLWLNVRGALCHFTHHVGTTNSAAYESTAVYKELVEAYNEAGRWGVKPPDVCIRSHRHRNFETRVPTKRGYGISLVTPAWQLKTPFTWKLGLGRSSTPQIGGVIIRNGDEDEIYTRSKVWNIERSKEEKI